MELNMKLNVELNMVLFESEIEYITECKLNLELDLASKTIEC